MRNFLFLVFAKVNHLTSALIRGIADFAVFLNSELGCLILRIIDKERLNHILQVSKQQEEIGEFEVLSTISRVIDDAVQRGSWAEEHQHNINHFANVLFHDYDWEQNVIQETIGRMITDAEALMEALDGQD